MSRPGGAWLLARTDLAFGGAGLVRLSHPLLPEPTAAVLGPDGLRLFPRVAAPEPLGRAAPEVAGPFLVRFLGLAAFLKWRGLGIFPRDLLSVGSMPGMPARPWLPGPPVPDWRAVPPAVATAVIALRLSGRRVEGTTVAELRSASARSGGSATGATELATLCLQADALGRRPELLLHEIARLTGTAAAAGPDLLGLAFPAPGLDGNGLTLASGRSALLLARGAARRRPGESSFVEIGAAARLDEGAVLREVADVLRDDPRGEELKRRAGGAPFRPLPEGPPLTLVGRDVPRWDPRSRAAWADHLQWEGVTRLEVRDGPAVPWDPCPAHALESPPEAADAASLVYLPFASMASAVTAWELMTREARGDAAALVAAARRLATTFEPGGPEPSRRTGKARRAAADRRCAPLSLLARGFPLEEAAAVLGLPADQAAEAVRAAVAGGELEEREGLFSFREESARARRAASLSRAERRDVVERLESLGLEAERTVPALLARGEPGDRQAAVQLLGSLVARGEREAATELLLRAAPGDWLDAPASALDLFLRAGDTGRVAEVAGALAETDLGTLDAGERRRLLRGLARAGAPERALALVPGGDPASRLLQVRLLLDAHRDDEAGERLDATVPRGPLPRELEVERALLSAEREGRRARYAAAARAFTRVERLLPSLLPAEAMEAASTAGCLAADQGLTDAALAFFRLARETAPDDGRRADAAFDMAAVLGHAGRFADAERALDEALARYASAGERDRYLSALGNRADMALAAGDVAGARRDLGRVLEHDRAAGREYQLVFALPTVQALALLDGDLVAAAQVYAEARSVGTRYPEHPAWRELELNEARRSLMEGAPGEAAARLAEVGTLPDNRMQNEPRRRRLAASAALDRGESAPEPGDLPPGEDRLLAAERELAAGRALPAAALRLLEDRAASPQTAPEAVLRILEWVCRFPGRVPAGLRTSGARAARGLGLARAAGRLGEPPPAPAAAAEAVPGPAGLAESPGAYVAEDASTVEVFRLLDRVARSRLTVLVLGETGTGKEIVARELHRLSGRHPFRAVNVAALTPTLLESELFGHVRGAFTGADRDRAGVIESASGGTLFLDEVGDLPLPLQPKLLRVLQERELSRVGEVKVRRVDLRVVAATHHDLRSMVGSGLFRADLYQRLNAFELTLAPLRERPKDLEALIARLLGDATLAPEARRLLRAYGWPGNVRELAAAVESARVLAGGAARIEAEHLPPAIRVRSVAARRPVLYRDALRETRRAVIVESLAACGGNRTRAAARIGISRQHLLTEMKALDIR